MEGELVEAIWYNPAARASREVVFSPLLVMRA